MDHDRHEGMTSAREFRFLRHVKDFAGMRSFYEETFGWPVIKEFKDGVMYNTGASTFEIIYDPEALKPNLSSHISISVPDAQSLFEHLKDRVTIVFPIRDNAWGDRSFAISDPDGFQITLFTPTK